MIGVEGDDQLSDPFPCERDAPVGVFETVDQLEFAGSFAPSFYTIVIPLHGQAFDLAEILEVAHVIYCGTLMGEAC